MSKRKSAFVTLSVLAACTLLLFQNCSKPQTYDYLNKPYTANETLSGPSTTQASQPTINCSMSASVPELRAGKTVTWMITVSQALAADDQIIWSAKRLDAEVSPTPVELGSYPGSMQFSKYYDANSPAGAYLLSALIQNKSGVTKCQTNESQVKFKKICTMSGPTALPLNAAYSTFSFSAGPGVNASSIQSVKWQAAKNAEAFSTLNPFRVQMGVPIYADLQFPGRSSYRVFATGLDASIPAQEVCQSADFYVEVY